MIMQQTHRAIHFGELQTLNNKQVLWSKKKSTNKPCFPLEDSGLTKLYTSGFLKCLHLE